MSSRNFLVRLISSIWSGVDGVRKILHLLLLVTLFLVFFGAISGTSPILPQQAMIERWPNCSVTLLRRHLCRTLLTRWNSRKRMIAYR